MTESDFIKYVKSECRKCKIKFRAFDQKSVEKCAGYFLEEEMLVVAKRHPDYFTTLIHEFCHLTQWRDKNEAWMGLESLGKESHAEFNRWLDGDSVRNISGHIDNIKNLEYDCECRGVELIDILGLPVKKSEFIQKANAYIHLYEAIKDARRWCVAGKAPSSVYEVWSQMPDDKIVKTTPQWVVNLILEECYEHH